jgi:hypothetical protein
MKQSKRDIQERSAGYITCSLTESARRALDELRPKGGARRGQLGRVISELLVTEQARRQTWGDVIVGRLSDGPGGRRKRRPAPPDAA